MPDSDRTPHLDQRLGQARTDLLDAIDQPPLDLITGRAATLRHRRRARNAGAALVAVVGLAILLVRPWAHPQAAAPTGDAPTTAPTYAASGIVINGLTRPMPAVPDLPGKITDVEFTDSEHGYLLAAQCDPGKPAEPCTVSFARTTDGGFTWQRGPLPANAAPTGATSVPDLIAFPDGRLVLTEAVPYLSSDAGQSWQPVPRGSSMVALSTADRLRITLRSGAGGSCQGSLPEVWSATAGYRGSLSTTLPIAACWAAARPTADGAWWLGGVEPGGGPAVAVSRDGGQNWQAIALPITVGGPVSAVQVSALGSHLYAVVLGQNRTIRAIFHSADGGRTFTLTRQTSSAEPATLAGEAVPLLDGRLLVTTETGRWYASQNDGASFTQVTGNLPEVGAVRRTWAGYVAYDLFGRGAGSVGWTAFSPDGTTWRKLQIH